ncbi:MAG: hypothetical protein Q4G25_04815 [Paracoccus sp. (in: a-proteobacteria)]|nr:hypothetical protein [Paracoccus sp. (in: a-proteobacteria)]
MPENPIILVLPSMAVAALPVMQALYRSGAEVVADPIPATDDVTSRRAQLEALITPGGLRRILVLPAPALYDLGLLNQVIPDNILVFQIDTADMVRTVLRALRIEAWITEGQMRDEARSLPIPAEAGFSAPFDAHRLGIMVQEIQTGRAILDGALRGLRSRRVMLDETPVAVPELGLTPADFPLREPLADLTDDPGAVTAQIQAQRLPCPDVDLPPLPAIHMGAPRLMAFVCGRNISPYLSVLASKMQEEDVPLIYIDNDSEDGSAEIAASLIGRGIAGLHRLEWDGSFSVEAQLRAKARLIDHHAPRWILNIDADEIIEHRDPGKGLHDLVQGAEDTSHNAINFNEFVFLPLPGEDFAGQDYAALMRRYYMFAPMPFRLIRLWRNGAGLSNLASAGHRLTGPVRLAPDSHNLRHYIALSEKAAAEKYVGRVFSPAELARRWHANRTGLSAERLRMPPAGDPRLFSLDPDAMKALRRDAPLGAHWWAWPQPGA